MPKRKVRSGEDLLEVCPEAKDLFIDDTESRTTVLIKSRIIG